MANKDDIYAPPPGSPVIPDVYDVRVRLRYLTKGILTAEAVKKHVSSLPDDADAAEHRNYDALVKDESTEGSSSTDGPFSTH